MIDLGKTSQRPLAILPYQLALFMQMVVQYIETMCERAPC